MTTADPAAMMPEADSDKIITFPQGIPGFETYTKYTLFHKEEKEVSAYWLESIDAPKVAFTLVDPTIYGLNYALDLSSEEQDILEVDDPKLLAILLMLSKTEEAEGTASALNANIVGPIIINMKNRLGLQKVLVRSHVDVNIIQD